MKVLDQVHGEQHEKPRMVAKNVIIFIGDGMGMTTITAGRILKGQRRNDGATSEATDLEFDRFPHIGLSRVILYTTSTDQINTMNLI